MKSDNVGKSTRRFSYGMLAFVALVGCTTPENKIAPDGGNSVQSASKSVDEAGATIELPGSASLWLPAGAVNATTELTVTVIESPLELAGDVKSAVIQIEPFGLEFSQPVRLTLNVKGVSATDTLRTEQLSSSGASQWELIGGTAYDAATETATIDVASTGIFAASAAVSCTPKPVTSTCSCPAGQLCTAAGGCVAIESWKLCESTSFYVLNGQIPNPDFVPDDALTDEVSSGVLAAAITSQCGFSLTTVNQAKPGVLDACNDSLLLEKGKTILLTGGDYAQRLSGFLSASAAPVQLISEEANTKYSYVTRTGTKLVTIAAAEINDFHDYFVLSIIRDPSRGANILHVWGAGWYGTPAGVYYLTSKGLAELKDGTRAWKQYILVEYTDVNKNGVRDAADTYNVIATDVP